MFARFPKFFQSRFPIRLFCFLLLILISFEGFSHEAEKQTEHLKEEALTEKWRECEKLFSSEEDYRSALKEFFGEVEKAKPSATIIYYFPEANEIYENLYQSASKLISIVGNGDMRTEKFPFSETQSLRAEISSGISEWEIFQKNLTKFQLEQLYYSYKILIAVIVILLLLAMVLFILYRFTSYSKKENTAFTRQMIQTQEAERERISNELHDTVCQDLRVLQFRLEDEESVELCKKIASDVRNTCYALTPSDLNEGIFESLISLCALNHQNSNVKVILSIQDDVKENPQFLVFKKEKSLNIYRIVQEILANAIKHAEAETISVLVRNFDKENFRIIISDDGKGFDLKSALKKKKHFGLKNIYTRAENLNATVSIKSEEGEGTQVTVTIPYK